MLVGVFCVGTIGLEHGMVFNVWEVEVIVVVIIGAFTILNQHFKIFSQMRLHRREIFACFQVAMSHKKMFPVLSELKLHERNVVCIFFQHVLRQVEGFVGLNASLFGKSHGTIHPVVCLLVGAFLNVLRLQCPKDFLILVIIHSKFIESVFHS